jgi:Zn-dependent metalloprotease
MTSRFKLPAAGVFALALLAGHRAPTAQGQDAPRVSRVAAVGPADLRVWDPAVDRMIRNGQLELMLDREDTMIEGRRHRRFTQTLNGVPVYGADIARQTDPSDLTISVFGTLYDGITISTDPKLSAEGAQAAVSRLTGVELGPERLPRLTILPREGGAYTLVYQARVATPEDITLFFSAATRTGRPPPSGTASACSAIARR